MTVEDRAAAATDPWRTVTNPIFGDEVTFLETAEDSGGARVVARIAVVPGGSNPMHFHRTYAEEFEVLEGRLTVELDGARHELGPGERVVAPIGSRHRWANDGTERLVFLVTVTPAARFEETIRIAYGLAHDGKTNAKGIPSNPLHLAVLFDIGDTFIAGVPLWLQRGLAAPLAAIARRRGVPAELRRYVQRP